MSMQCPLSLLTTRVRIELYPRSKVSKGYAMPTVRRLHVKSSGRFVGGPMKRFQCGATIVPVFQSLVAGARICGSNTAAPTTSVHRTVFRIWNLVEKRQAPTASTRLDANGTHGNVLHTAALALGSGRSCRDVAESDRRHEADPK